MAASHRFTIPFCRPFETLSISKPQFAKHATGRDHPPMQLTPPALIHRDDSEVKLSAQDNPLDQSHEINRNIPTPGPDTILESRHSLTVLQVSGLQLCSLTNSNPPRTSPFPEKFPYIRYQRLWFLPSRKMSPCIMSMIKLQIPRRPCPI